MKYIFFAILFSLSTSLLADDERHYSCSIQPIFSPKDIYSPTEYFEPTVVYSSYFEGIKKIDFKVDNNAVRVHLQIIRGYDENNAYNIALANMAILVAENVGDFNTHKETHYKQRTGFKTLDTNDLPEKFNLYINGKAAGSMIYLNSGYLIVSATCTKL